RAENRNLGSLLHERRFDHIDVDPYGTPVPFLDDAFRALRRRGYLSVTATDKGALCGTHPRACLRKYMASPMKTEYADETGLRILVGYCARTAAKYDLGISPLVSYSFQHHFRTYLEVREGATRANESRKKIGYACHDIASGERSFSETIKENHLNGGPLWTGNLFDRNVTSRLRVRKCMDAGIHRLVELWNGEAEGTPMFYTTDEISGILKCSPPPMSTIFENLKANGFTASRTHFSPVGFRTDAPMDELKRIFRT
ncbi:MAG: tRNA (guanine(10)-N(2))-dimethyltransferase, partial [Thermoplasmata archaeon]|nr:tRNA (guanine(10)-N(2))-dimethyltransferase [Thermoplasmata archaeon]